MKQLLIFVIGILCGMVIASNMDVPANKKTEDKAENAEQALPPIVEYLKQSGIEKHALHKGQKAKDFTLVNAQGRSVSLYKLLKRGPVVLTFYRGEWCPVCNVELQQLQTLLPKIKSYGATLVAISPQTPDNSLSTSEKNALEFEVLSDVGSHVARAYGVSFVIPEEMRSKDFDLTLYNGEDHTYELPIPATYVIGRNRVVAYAFVNADYRKRANHTAILDTLAALKR